MAGSEGLETLPVHQSCPFESYLGEANPNTLKTLDHKEATRVKPLVFRFES